MTLNSWSTGFHLYLHFQRSHPTQEYPPALLFDQAVPTDYRRLPEGTSCQDQDQHSVEPFLKIGHCC